MGQSACRLTADVRRALERSRAGAPLLLPDIAVRVGPMAGAFKAMLQVDVLISLACSAQEFGPSLDKALGSDAHPGTH